MISKICLGTAQLGLAYGVNNQTGLISESEAFALLTCAVELGVTVIDTAAVYGLSESRIGNWLSKSNVPTRVITKLPKLTEISEKELQSQFDASLSALKCSRIYGLLLHDASMLKNEVVRLFLTKLKANGSVSRVGISAYHPAEAEMAISYGLIDLIQFPLNVFDRRFIDSGIIKLCNENQIEMHARSALLQGLLMMNHQEAEAKVSGSGVYIKRLKDLADEHCVDLYSSLIEFPISEGVDKVVLGIESIAQLIQLSNIVTGNSKLFNERVKAEVNHVDDKILLPYLW